MSALPRSAAQLAVDLAALVIAFCAAFVLRFDGRPPWSVVKTALVLAPWVALFKYALLVLHGVPQFAWRYVGLREATRIVVALAWGTAALLLLRLVYPLLVGVHPAFRYSLVPFGVIAMDAVLSVIGVVGVRTLRRVSVERRDREVRLEHSRAAPVRTLVVGAGDATAALLRMVEQHPELGVDPVALVDDDPTKAGTRIQGVRVLGTPREAAELCARHGIEQAIVPTSEPLREDLRTLLRALDGARIPVKVVPSVEQWVGRGAPPSLRDIELGDLLRRSIVTLDDPAVKRFLRGKRVLITGAGGSIGSEIVRQVATHSPKSLALVERGEHALYEIHREFAGRDVDVRPVLLDVNDEFALRECFEAFRPEVVFHAAAHKHVPMLEHNVAEAVRNNVGGTVHVVDAARATGVDALVFISTDKAVNPTSVMGATKRVGELYVQSVASLESRRYCAVRFGNVLGSSGSVVPLFREQIARGGPVTVTHPDVRRYFMTIPEATSLVLEAGALGGRGEIFILDMGEPVRIADLAEDMIRLSGYTPNRDIAIVFTGLRPGEKLFEELAVDQEHAQPTVHPTIHVARTRPQEAEALRAAIADLAAAARDGALTDGRERLRRLVPEATLAPDA